ncbi:hypothetical protein [Shewanella waksmanii]|uniref:hypothetical protein n=1 Tax=Shewanella waksmanii TaxID=213783 RepID=UPI003736D519
MSRAIKLISPKLAYKIVEEVKQQNCLLSEVAKRHGVSTKLVYQLVRQNDQQNQTYKVSHLKFEINQAKTNLKHLVNELTHLQQSSVQ